jgi:hypothetical protein
MLLLTGCAALSGAHPDPSSRAGQVNAIPWTNAKPTAFEHHLATPVPGSPPKRCQATDLLAGFRGSIAGGTIFLSARTSACVAGGVPTIELVGTTGPIQTMQAATSSPSAGDVVIAREFVVSLDTGRDNPMPVPLGGGGNGWVAVHWGQADPGSSTCANGLVPVSSIRMTLPGQTSAVRVEHIVDQQAQPIAVCPPVLQVGPIEPDTTANPANPPRYWSFKVAAPATAMAGRTMDFDVSLQNVYYRALQFSDGCPSYVEALAGPNDWTTGKEWYVLNCGPIGVVQPGATVLLAMKIEIPPSAPAGAYTLIWEMDVGDVSYGAATASFKVAAAAG